MHEYERKLPEALTAIREAAVPLGDEHDEERVLATIGDASVVLLGEATHGTNEFYGLRARITRALIQQRGFSAVAIEGDWPDAYAVNRFVQGDSAASGPVEALNAFRRFPTWMWRNTAVVDFIAWLRDHNRGMVDPRQRVGFYGLDLYSLHASMRAVVDYLEEHDPEAAREARRSYACFEDFGLDPEAYAWATSKLEQNSCEEAVARELAELQARRAESLRRRDPAALDELFYAEQNARLARNAERYYRTMFRGRVASWNIRDTHMAETLEELLTHLNSRGQPPKVVVWAHNSHVGDARATEMGRLGEVTLGQLVRERHPAEACLMGLTTYRGAVIAASDWGEAPYCKRVRPALPGSYEELFHDTGMSRFLLPMRVGSPAAEVLSTERLERAIGVIYRPETERFSHYFKAQLAAQFDAVIHVDDTRAVEPIDVAQEEAWEPGEAAETYPSGM